MQMCQVLQVMSFDSRVRNPSQIRNNPVLTDARLHSTTSSPVIDSNTIVTALGIVLCSITSASFRRHHASFETDEEKRRANQ